MMTNNRLDKNTRAGKIIDFILYFKIIIDKSIIVKSKIIEFYVNTRTDFWSPKF